jgi:hypothetical protein
MPSIYVETTIPSYLAAHPSRDLIIAAHQQITHDWWRTARDRFDLYISEAVLNELRGGDAEAAIRRLEIISGLPVLAMNNDVRSLVHEYDRRLGLIGRARADLPHFAFAVAYSMDYLVTWNCRHIANGEVVRRLRDANAELTRFTPLIITPEEILDVSEGVEP